MCVCVRRGIAKMRDASSEFWMAKERFPWHHWALLQALHTAQRPVLTCCSHSSSPMEPDPGPRAQPHLLEGVHGHLQAPGGLLPAQLLLPLDFLKHKLEGLPRGQPAVNHVAILVQDHGGY